MRTAALALLRGPVQAQVPPLQTALQEARSLSMAQTQARRQALLPGLQEPPLPAPKTGSLLAAAVTLVPDQGRRLGLPMLALDPALERELTRALPPAQQALDNEHLQLHGVCDHSLFWPCLPALC